MEASRNSPQSSTAGSPEMCNNQCNNVNQINTEPPVSLSVNQEEQAGQNLAPNYFNSINPVGVMDLWKTCLRHGPYPPWIQPNFNYIPKHFPVLPTPANFYANHPLTSQIYPPQNRMYAYGGTHMMLPVFIPHPANFFPSIDSSVSFNPEIRTPSDTPMHEVETEPEPSQVNESATDPNQIPSSLLDFVLGNLDNSQTSSEEPILEEEQGPNPVNLQSACDEIFGESEQNLGESEQNLGESEQNPGDPEQNPNNEQIEMENIPFSEVSDDVTFPGPYHFEKVGQRSREMSRDPESVYSGEESLGEVPALSGETLPEVNSQIHVSNIESAGIRRLELEGQRQVRVLQFIPGVDLSSSTVSGSKVHCRAKSLPKKERRARSCSPVPSTSKPWQAFGHSDKENNPGKLVCISAERAREIASAVVLPSKNEEQLGRHEAATTRPKKRPGPKPKAKRGKKKKDPSVISSSANQRGRGGKRVPRQVAGSERVLRSASRAARAFQEEFESGNDSGMTEDELNVEIEIGYH